MQLPNDTETELWLLGFFAAASRMRDRRPTSGGGRNNDYTNLPESANDLVSKQHAVAAEELVFSMTLPLGAFDEIYTPGPLAKGLFMRSDGELAGTSLAMIDPSKWDQDEIEAVKVMTFRFKRAAHRLAASGYFNLHPGGYDDPGGLPWDKTGLARACEITSSGLSEARRRTRGTKYERWSDSILDAVNDETRRKAPQWAQAEWRQRSGFSS